MATKTRITAEDFENLPSIDGKRELINGEIVEMTPANWRHGTIAARVSHWLSEYVDRIGSGSVGVEVGYVLNLPYDAERVLGPDVSFISKERVPEGRAAYRFYRGAPDLAVEVLSPSDKSSDLEQKILDYFQAGTLLVWVIAPESRSATVYRRDGSARLLRETESLEGEYLLPGLSIPLAILFE